MGRRGAPEESGQNNPIPALLTRYQVLGEKTDSRGESPRAKNHCLHQLVHQRLRTTMDILRPEHEDDVRP